MGRRPTQFRSIHRLVQGILLAALLVACGCSDPPITPEPPAAPQLACPPSTTITGAVGAGQPVTYPQATVTGGLPPLVVVCNPPWLPARASSPIEHAVYDEGSRMLRGFLSGLAEHLAPGGEGWLILSDLAEHLDACSSEAASLVLDLSGLEYVSSAGLRCLMMAARQATAHQSRIMVAAPQPVVAG